jgi:acyl-coenzyme A thioesterase PaaI-like protein
MPESFESRRFRWGFNLFPAYRGTGGRVTYISSDWREVRVSVPLSWRTRNYVGTIYGGSIYGAVDPIYMLMLMKILGKEYNVWDKAAKIRFKRPGRETLYVDFRLEKDEIAEIKRLAETERSIDRVYELLLRDKNGVVHAVIEKTIYIAKKRSESQ